jgi:hypothetical protein
MNYPVALNAPDRRSGGLSLVDALVDSSISARAEALVDAPPIYLTVPPTPTRQSVDEAALIEALAIVVQSARTNGQTLEDLTLEVLADDSFLEPHQRLILSEIVAKAWELADSTYG